jgi:hypothetical protein
MHIEGSVATISGLLSETVMTRNHVLCLALAATLLVAACNSGTSSSSSSGSAPAAVIAPNAARGQLLQNPPAQLGSFSPSDLLKVLGVSPVGVELLSLVYSPTCGVNTYHLEYGTVGGKNESTTASGALMIPTGTAAACQGPFPIVLYAHGTTPDKGFNIADITASSSGEGLLMAALFASHGYIVVAPNYAGYDTSSLPYHPYLVADQQSKDMIDSLTAAQTALATLGQSASGRVFVTGYSQGGYVAMATHRAMQAAGMNVTASAPMSGPYALAAFGDAIFAGQVNASGPENTVLLINGYQHSYGNVYTSPTDVFEAAYAGGIDGLLPTAQPLSTLQAQGKLPQHAVFSSTPPSPEYAAITPATQPAALAPVFALGFGTNNLITNSYRGSYLQDSEVQPDGGFPTATTGVPAVAPGLGLRQDLKLNDLRDWLPSAPVLLCAGSGDPTVFYFNTELMEDFWTKNATAATSFTTLDVDSPVTPQEPYAAEKAGFAAAKGALQVKSGSNAVLAAYHATLVPPFCISAVKSFFDGHNQTPSM